MRTVQGSVVKLRIRPLDDAGQPYDPPEIVLAYKPPGGSLTTQTLTGAQIIRQAKGVFTASIDTSAAPGDWEYEVATQGVNARVMRGSFFVEPALT